MSGRVRSRDGYSPTRHLAHALCPTHDPQKFWFGMFAAYFDDTGGDDQHGVGAFGLVSTVAQWQRFEIDWRHILSMPHFDLEYLHMKELRHHGGRFSKFGANPRLERDLFERVNSVIGVRSRTSAGAYITHQTYGTINSVFRVKEDVGPPFAFAGLLATWATVRWMNVYHSGEPIEYIHASGTRGLGRLADNVRRHFGIVINTNGEFKKQLPLQASDYLAWEHQRFLRTGLPALSAGAIPPLRESFFQLIKRLTPDNWFILKDKAPAAAFCGFLGIPRRR